MPRRTNEFQTLITRIQAALHGKKAKVEESAMVYNHDTEKETEIDILITFELGATSYRTGVECREHTRPGGPSWIAEVKAKRDGCRLDKMIAIHAKGFTDSAVRLGEKYGIETIAPEVISEIDWQSKVGPFKSLIFQTVKCKLRNGLKFNLLGKNPAKCDEATSFIRLPGESDVCLQDFVNQIRESIREDFSKRFDITGKPKPDFAKSNLSKVVDLFVTFPDDTVLKPSEGGSLLVVSAIGDAEIVVDTIVIDELTYIKQKDTVIATHADFELMGQEASITLTEQKQHENEMGICIAWDGGQIKGPRAEKEKLSRKVRVYVKERSK